MFRGRRPGYSNGPTDSKPTVPRFDDPAQTDKGVPELASGHLCAMIAAHLCAMIAAMGTYWRTRTIAEAQAEGYMFVLEGGIPMKQPMRLTIVSLLVSGMALFAG